MSKPVANASQGDAAELIIANAQDFLNGGLRSLFAADATARDVKIAIVAIQTSVELLAKYRLVREHGLLSIVRGNLPPGDLLASSAAGRLRTIGYGECLKAIREDESFTEMEDELIRQVQDLRNSLVHFAAELDVSEVRMQLAWLLIRALGMFAAGRDRDHGEFENHARFLDPENFRQLVAYEPYRTEAVDSAIDSVDSIKVYRCWECAVDSLSLRESENYFCHCCGLALVSSTVGFTDCGVCGASDGVFFDRLNENDGVSLGKCLHCHTKVDVGRCAGCGGTASWRRGLVEDECNACDPARP